MKEQFAKDQAILPTRVISIDMEEIRVTHYDWMKMNGEIPMIAPTEPVKTRLVGITYLDMTRIGGNSCLH